MDNEIKRLLKLSKIPNFRMSDSEKKKLEEWKSQQIDVKPKKRVIPKGYTELEGIGANGKNTLVGSQDALESLSESKTTRKYTRRKKTNVVKSSDKEIGKIEES